MSSSRIPSAVAPSTRSQVVEDIRSAEICAVALNLVARKGYDAVTMDEIAAEASASKRTLYRRWPSKAEMVVDAVRRNSRQLEEPEDTGDLRDDLFAVLEIVARELIRDADLVIALVAAGRRHEELMRTVSERLRNPGEAIGQRPIERAIARGALPPTTGEHLVADVAMPMLLHRLIWQEPLDGTFVEFVVDSVMMPLLRAH